MEPPQKKLPSSLRGTATAAVHGDALAVEEGDVPNWAFSLAQEHVSPAPKHSPWLETYIYIHILTYHILIQYLVLVKMHLCCYKD